MNNLPLLPAGYRNPVQLLAELKRKPEHYWIKKGEKRALQLFSLMAQRVPAYKDFLKKNNINAEKIKTINDFKHVPTIDKDNYLRIFPLEKLSWDGELKAKQWVFSTTSGSTGEPFYFPRLDAQDEQYALTAELYLRTNFAIERKSTLYINGFAMGAWIGGLFTYQAIRNLTKRGNYNISIINPGIFKEEIIKAVKNIGDKFDQIIIGGYPPMIKATIDEGIKNGLRWEDYQLGFIFSAEGFSEKFRDYIVRKAGLKNPYKDTLNHYGTVDLGTMAHETPLSILIRRLVDDKPAMNNALFKKEFRQPTLAQYMPDMFYFEEINGSLLCSAPSGIPLVRYDLKDYGGIYTLQQITKMLSDFGASLPKETERAEIADTVWQLPFIYVFERKDFTVKLYGANIYPDTIRKTLYEREFDNFLTGKFTMMIDFDRQQNQYLQVHIELKKDVKSDEQLKKNIQELIIKRLLHENSEYRSNYQEASHRQIPKIALWEYEHSLYFGAGGKQKWVKK